MGEYHCFSCGNCCLAMISFALSRDLDWCQVHLEILKMSGVDGKETSLSSASACYGS